MDGRDLNEIPLEELRAAIGMVPQEAFLFSETIRENVAFGAAGSEDVTRERLVRSVTLAQLASTIEGFPEGYETLLGERGINLSGGQKQRTALARALIRDPLILLLDDCLAGVDAETEEEILKQLRGELAGRTTLLVSHRISVMAIADVIVVLDGGRIVERGTHESLLTRGGLYARLARLQRIADEIEHADNGTGSGGGGAS